VLRLGAALAYYGLTALVPTLTLVAGIIAIVVDAERLRDFLRGVFGPVLGAEADRLADAVVEALPSGLGALGPLGVAALALGGTVFVVALMDVADEIWELPPRGGPLGALRRRFAAFGGILGLAVGLLVLLALGAFVDLVAPVVPGIGSLTGVAGRLGALAAVATVLVAVYLLAPSVPVPPRPAVVAAAVAAPMAVLGTLGVGVYLDRVAATSAATVAGAAFLLLVWFYVEAQILLAGLVLSRTLAERWGTSKEPGTTSRVP